MKKLKLNKGFTLVECIVAIGLFAAMAAIVCTILNMSITRQQNINNESDELDKQIEAMATLNTIGVSGDYEEKDIDVDFQFYKNGTAIAEDSGVSLKQYSADDIKGFQLNTIDYTPIADGTVVVTTSEDEDDPDDDDDPLKVTDDSLVYGNRGIDYIQITVETVSAGKYKLDVKINDTRGNSTQNDKYTNKNTCISLALPGFIKSYSSTAGNNARTENFAANRVRIYCTSENGYGLSTSQFILELTNEDGSDYTGELAQWFGAAAGSSDVTLNDDVTPGVYEK